MKDTLGVLLAGGAGERLYPLTRDRAKPAVTFGGIYRIIDITLSNCLNSDLRRVYILTQYKALSLNRHIREGWNILGNEIGEFIEILPPDEARERELVHGHGRRGISEHLLDWLRTTQARADSLRRPHLQNELWPHAEAAQRCGRRRYAGHPADGSLRVQSASAWWRWIAMAESPASRKNRNRRSIRSTFDPTKTSGSMGIYIFNTDVLIPVLLKDAEDPQSSHDFGKDILPKMLDEYRGLRVQLRR